MNYISEINAFYDWSETNPVSDSAVNLWHAIMAVNNKSGWKEEFSVAVSTLECKTKLSKSSIIRARSQLKQLGRLHYKEGKGNQSCAYSLIPFHTDTQDVMQSKAKEVKVLPLKKEVKENIDGRKLIFLDTLKPFLQTYGKDLLNDFYKYWTEPDSSNTKFRREFEKTWGVGRRLATWAKNDKNFKKPQNGTQFTNTTSKTAYVFNANRIIETNTR